VTACVPEYASHSMASTAKDAARELLSDAAYRTRVTRAYGDAGREWLQSLPESVHRCAARWTLELDPPYPVSFNVVFPAVDANGNPVALKLMPPTAAEFAAERAFLSLAPGRAARMIASDAELGALLLERAVPGTKLSELASRDDEAATRAAAPVLRDFAVDVPPRGAFPTVEDWSEPLNRLARDEPAWIPGPLGRRAARIYRALAALPGDRRLLHGDLHHFNVLASSESEWVAIDPKGVVGPPSFEVGAFLRNPFPEFAVAPDVEALTRRRIATLAEGLHVPRKEIWGWGFSQAVLSAAWADDEDDIAWRSYALECARILERAEPT
jgi:streptomycin 6-kinase